MKNVKLIADTFNEISAQLGANFRRTLCFLENNKNNINKFRGWGFLIDNSPTELFLLTKING